MSNKLSNYLGGQWHVGSGAGSALFDPVLGTELCRVDATGLDLKAGFAFAREQAGPALRALSYAQRAALLHAVVKVLQANRDAYYEIATANSGTVKNDSAVDIDGGIYTLSTYAKLGEALGERHYMLDGEAARLGKDPLFQSQHVLTPTSASASRRTLAATSSMASVPPKCCTSSSPMCRVIVRYGTTGWPVPGYEIELRGEDGQPLQANADGSMDIGDLYIKGPSAAFMYWKNREKSRGTFQGHWTKSGDKYMRNTDGTYTYAGRSDDMLKVSGIYVSPFEVEATLVQHPAVLEAAVIGVEDEEGLTKTKAFVVLKSGQTATEADLKAFVKDRLAAYKYPRFITFVNELPKTATGKIQRFRLREQEKW